MPAPRVKRATTPADLDAAYALRHEVFVVEQEEAGITHVTMRKRLS